MADTDFDDENKNSEKLSSFLEEQPSSDVTEDATIAGIVGALTKRQLASKKAKAEKIVDQFSVPSKTASEAAEQIASSGSKKSAQKSAQVFEDLIARAQMASSKTPLLERLSSLASKLPVRGAAGAAIGAAAAIPALYGDEGNAPEPNDPYLSPYRAGVKEIPSGLASKASQPFSNKQPSSDTESQIVADALASSPAVDEFKERPEYKKLVEQYSQLPQFKNMANAYISRPGVSSAAEDLAGSVLREFDELNSKAPGQRSVVEDSRLAELSAQLYPSASYKAPSSLKSANKIPGTELMERQNSSPLNITDTEGSIIADALKTPSSSQETKTDRIIADLEAAPPSVKEQSGSAALSAKPTPGPSQPSSVEVAKQNREDDLTKIVGKENASKISEYEELMRRYKDAQEKQEEKLRQLSMMEGAERFVSARGGIAPREDYYKEQREQALKGMDRFQKEEEFKKEARRNDPNSEESESARNLLKSQGITVPDNISAAFIEKQYPQFANILARREAAKEREISRKERAEDRAFAREQLLSDKDTKDFTKLSEKLTAELASSRSAFGKGANIVRSAEAIETLVSQMNPKDINTRQIQELARGLDAMLSQGAATISGTKKLVPESYSADWAKIAEYITSKPKGAGQEAFVKQMMETVEREKETAKRQMRQTQNKILSGYEHLKERYPERYKRMLQEFGADAESPSVSAQKEKVVVEKDGKQYRLPKEQLDRALKQGYKEVK